MSSSKEEPPGSAGSNEGSPRSAGSSEEPPGSAGNAWSLPYPEWIPRGALVYVTFDIDALDPACAPGVSHPVPGGLTTRQVLDWLIGFPWRLAGMDLVEVNPSLDLNNLTSITAGRLLHEAMALALARH